MAQHAACEGHTLLLVDGSSFLYRAYHAMPDLRGPTGEPTGAIYGMVTMLRRLRREVCEQIEAAHKKTSSLAEKNIDPSTQNSIKNSQELSLEALCSKDLKYSACIFDSSGQTFRKKMYAPYKAQRRATPPDLVAQIPPIHDMVRALGWPVLMSGEVEADDIIGTLARQAEARGMNVVIASGDKDFAQLVSDRISLTNTMSQEILDRAGVMEKWGIAPERIVDYLALIGDASDNIPGVPKCGPKTALKWLNEYETLDKLIEEAHQIKGVVGENLRGAIDFLDTARTLLTIRTDCELLPPYDSFERSLLIEPESVAQLQVLYEKHGFRRELSSLRASASFSGQSAHSLLEAQNDSKDAEKTPAIALPLKKEETHYDVVLTWAQFDEWLAIIEAAPLTALDTETTSLDPFSAKLVGLSLCVEPGRAAYIPLMHRGPDAPQQLPIEEVLDRLRPWLTNPAHKKVGQHLKYDEHVLANCGIELAGVQYDTLLESYVLEAHRKHDLGNLALRHLGLETISYEDLCGKGVKQISFDQAPFKEAAEYGAEDADLTLRVHQTLYPQIAENPEFDHLYQNIELPTARVLYQMERTGVLIDTALLAVQSTEMATQLLSLEMQAYDTAGERFNLNSPKQIGAIFFEKLGLPVIKKTPGGTPSTDEEVLSKLAEDYPLPKLLLEYRSIAKLKSTYVDKLPRMVNAQTGRVHTNYAQAVAVTGRLASNDPNLQNIPIRNAQGRRIREAFIAPPGCQIVSADYSQIELRILAHLCEDAQLLHAFKQEEDVHRATAAEIFSMAPQDISSEQRRVAKVINFGLIYGMSAFGLASALNITREAARLYIDRYFMRYPGVADYMERTREQAKQKGYVETAFGRRLWLPDIHGGSGPRRQAAERAAINAPMQGTAADLIKLSMIAVQNWITGASDSPTKRRTKLIMQVHDELVLEVPDEELSEVQEAIPRLMSSVAQFKVPLLAEVGVGKNWGQAH